MRETEYGIGQAMQSPWFRETVCDLFNTVQEVERKVKGLSPEAEFELFAVGGQLQLDAYTDAAESVFEMIDLVDDDLAHFRERTGLPLFIVPSSFQDKQ